MSTHLSDLPHSIVNEPPPLAPVVQGEPLSGFVLADERGGAHSRVGELEILVQVVEPVEKVAHVPAQHAQHAVVPVLAHETHKVHSHLIHELALAHPEDLQRENI